MCFYLFVCLFVCLFIFFFSRKGMVNITMITSYFCHALFISLTLFWSCKTACPAGPQGPAGINGSCTGSCVNSIDLVNGNITLAAGSGMYINTTGQVFTFINTAGGAFALANITQDVYVDKSGSDITGSGVPNNPYFTISHAMSTILDASPSKRYGIKVGPGKYSNNISYKANVFIIGDTPLNTFISGNIDLNDSSWNSNGIDDRSGAQNIDLQSTGYITFDFTLQNSSSGKMYFWNCKISPGLVMIAY